MDLRIALTIAAAVLGPIFIKWASEGYSWVWVSELRRANMFRREYWQHESVGASQVKLARWEVWILAIIFATTLLALVVLVSILVFSFVAPKPS